MCPLMRNYESRMSQILVTILLKTYSSAKVVHLKGETWRGHTEKEREDYRQRRVRRRALLTQDISKVLISAPFLQPLCNSNESVKDVRSQRGSRQKKIGWKRADQIKYRLTSGCPMQTGSVLSHHLYTLPAQPRRRDRKRMSRQSRERRTRKRGVTQGRVRRAVKRRRDQHK